MMKALYTLLVLALAFAATDQAGAQQQPATQTPERFPGFLTPQPIELPGGARDNDRVLAPADSSLPERLQAALDRSYAQINNRVRHGVQVSVIAPGLGQWNGVAGYSDSTTPISSTMRFQIGSISKTFTAAVILQLMEEGKLALDDSIGRWITPHANINGAATVRQLLNHSSGIFDYLNDDTTQAVLIDAYFDNPNRLWTPEEILGYVKAPNFKPGKNTRYSNTNYVLLGMIIEQITGHSVGHEIHSRILDPLNLTNTYIPWEDTVAGEFAHGWSIGFTQTGQIDISPIPNAGALSAAWTAGGMVSTADDLARWAKALYNGNILKKSTLDTMLKTKTTAALGDIGLGVFKWNYYSKAMYGHTGGILGYESWMFSIPRDSISVGILINSFDPSLNIGSNDIAVALLGEVYRTVSSAARPDAVAGTLSLEGCYPNPAREETTIRYSVASAAAVRLEILDAMGNRVATAVDGMIEAGSHIATVNLRGFPSGTYFYALNADGQRMVRAIRIAR
jgi:D-alanyl-D-alanine carboxypeptidase